MRVALEAGVPSGGLNLNDEAGAGNGRGNVMSGSDLEARGSNAMRLPPLFNAAPLETPR